VCIFDVDSFQVQKKFITNLGFLLLLNLLIKPFWVLGIGVGIQNSVGPEQYGIYFTMLNFSYLFHIFLDFGINNFQNRNISQNPKAAGQLLSSLSVVKFGFGLVFMFLVMTLGKYIMEYPPKYIYLLLVVGLNQVLLSIVLFLRANLAGLQFFKVDSIISVLDRLLMIAICGTLLWGNVTNIPFQIEWFAYAQGAAYAATIFVALIILLFEVKVKLEKPQLKIVPSLIRKSLPFAVLTLIMTIYYRIDVIMIEGMMPNGVKEAGVYAQGYRLPEMASMFALLFATLLLPLFSNMLAKKESVIELMSLSFRLLITPAIIGAIAIYFYGMDFIRIFYSVEFEKSSDVQTVLMFTFIPLASTYIFGTLLTANGDMKTLNWISVLGLLVNVGLNYVLIPDIGIKGAAIATLVTQIVVVLLQLIYIGWQFKTAPRWQLIASLVVFSTGLYFLGFFMLGIGIDHKVQFILLCGIGVLWAVITGMVNIKAIYRILKLGD
jgi:O-antigen/teichoic acid export membrane protein